MRLGAILVLCAACNFHPGARPGGQDAAVAIDGPTDAPVMTVSRKQMEVVAGAGRAQAGAITIDVEVGHAVPVNKSVAGTVTVEGAPVIKP